MLRSIFAPALDASTDNITFCAAAEGAVSPAPIRARQRNSTRTASELLRPELLVGRRSTWGKTCAALTRLFPLEGWRVRRRKSVMISEAGIEIICSAPET